MCLSMTFLYYQQHPGGLLKQSFNRGVFLKYLSAPQAGRLSSFNKTKKRKKALAGNKPQVKGSCLKVKVMNPKKPNSALRQIAKTLTTTGFKVIAHIPGEGHNLATHGTILLQGARLRDLPGASFRVVRGVFDLQGVVGRMQGRSRYGAVKSFK